MQRAGYPGLGLKDIHDGGVSGRGGSVAVIDKPILPGHETDRDDPRIDNPHFHGAACVSILAGNSPVTRGVAPEATVYYFAVPDGPAPFEEYAAAMAQLLELNATLPREQRIRVVSVSHGCLGREKGAREWEEALEKARQAGLVVFYPGMPGLDFTGTGCPPDLDRGELRGLVLDCGEAKGGQGLRFRGYRLLGEARRGADLDRLEADVLSTYLLLSTIGMDFEEVLEVEVGGDVFGVPADFITTAGVEGEDSYSYWGTKG